jgi:RimJ/RimL family protein N-acetyltransferase
VLNHHDWGQGYATETGKALLAFGFEQLRLQPIWPTCDPANTASAHILEEVGIQRKHRLRTQMGKGTLA